MTYKMMIISACDDTGKPLSQQQIDADYYQLQRAHDEATSKEPNWVFFGGMLTINGHTYQVC